MTDSGLEPRDLELIAAFIDRRLSEEERRAFQERLDNEEALYEVFTETVRYRDQRAAGPAVVVEHPASRRQWGRLAAVAALLAVAVATPLVLRDLTSERYAESLVADGRLDPAPGPGWIEQEWPRMRGVSPLPGADAALRAGVQAMDLEVALRLGRNEDALILTQQLERTVESLELPEVVLVYYSELGWRLEAGLPVEDLLGLAEEAEAGFALQFPELAAAYRLGRWAEAGKLAARSGNRELLASRAFRREARELARPEVPWDEPLAAALEKSAGLLGVSAGELDLAALEAAFIDVIKEG